jgi:serine/threonine protein kinase/tetratricopeptide (TPR) repeat protein
MTGRARAAPWAEIDPYIEPFEAARRLRADVSLSDHLPAASHPHFLAILCELVRVDLEFGWAGGHPRPLEEYFSSFPALAGDGECRAQTAFEEYRLRQQAGQFPRPEDYTQRFGVDTSSWPIPHPGPGAAVSTINDRAEVRGLPTVVAPAEGQTAGPPHPGAPAPGAEEVLSSVSLIDPSVTDRLVRALGVLQEPLTEFLGFRVLRELGRGTFGRVYLARQGDLADREVVLKLSGDLRGEPQTLARLQHTNIVPIYSVHRLGPLHAFCMPYFGATTFARLFGALRRRGALPTEGAWLVEQLAPVLGRTDRGRQELAGRNYVGAVLWLGLRLAEGLAYAHERGVVHQDLKPANLLLADDGEPMLLDFNLARDPALAGSVPAAYIGGTLPYMSPERLRAFAEGRQHTDPRDDTYALGLILYELLTGTPAAPVHPAGSADAVARALIEARAHPVPDPRALNPRISPAVAAILMHCLAVDSTHRYQSARELAEDLGLHLTDRPLRYATNASVRERCTKWRRRNPRLASAYTIVGLALVLLGIAGGMVVWRDRELTRARAETERQQIELARSLAVSNFQQFRSELAASRLQIRTPAPTRRDVEEGLALARRAAARYGLTERSTPEELLAPLALDPGAKEHLREELAELARLLSRGAEFLARLRPDGAARGERLEEAIRFNELAERFSRDSEFVWLAQRHRADLLVALGRVDEARALRERAAGTAPLGASNLRTLAAERMERGEFAAASDLLKRANRADPQSPLGLMLLGYCYERLNQFPRAVGCYDAVLALRPESHLAFYRRAAAHAEAGEHAEAIEDFTASLKVVPEYVPAYLDRSLSYAARGDHRAAVADLDRVLTFPDAPTRVYFLRARYRAALGDRAGAAADRKEGLAREPNDEPSYIARGVARLPTDTKGALADFEQALRLNPRSLGALQNKASVLSEFLDRPNEALAALDAALDADPKYIPALIGRAVLRARAGARTDAHTDARAALALAPTAEVQYQAACVFALTARAHEPDRSEALRLLEAALRGGFGRAELAGDPDLNPLRNVREFQDLVAKYGQAPAGKRE